MEELFSTFLNILQILDSNKSNRLKPCLSIYQIQLVIKRAARVIVFGILLMLNDSGLLWSSSAISIFNICLCPQHSSASSFCSYLGDSENKLYIAFATLLTKPLHAQV